MYVGRFLRSSFPSRLRTPQLKAGRFHDRLYELSVHAFTDQKMELDLDDLDDVAGGKKHSHYPPFQGLGSQAVYDRMMQLRNHTFRR